MAEVVITAENFEQEVLKADIPVLVDFWATWCGPCKMVGPIVSEIAEENAGKIKVCKVDVDENPSLAAQFNVSSIPTLMAFKGGQAVNVIVGARPKAAILSMFE